VGRVLVLVEGATERSIVENVLAPDFGTKGIYLFARIVGKPGHKGGNSFESARKDILNLLHQEPSSIVTTFFDYYALPDDWPGIPNSKGNSNENGLEIIKSSIRVVIANDMGYNFDQRRFLPYIQFHEVESLLYADPKKMAEVFENPDLEVEFEEIVTACGGCEEINDGYDTAPSKRILRLFPSYKKGRSLNAHAYRIAQHIGTSRIRERCPLFSKWCQEIEELNRLLANHP
jgi:hypothetical protein